MANTSIVTQEMLQDTLQNYHENLVYPFLNGATHTGCVPLGTILPYFGETAPTHFLICDGTEYAKADYPELAEHLLALTDPTPYAGSDANHFKVPDLRGEFLRGTGTNSHVNQGNGANVGVHQDGTEFPRLQIYQEKLFSSKADVNPETNADKIITSDGFLEINKSASYTLENSTKSFTSRPTNTSVTYIIAYRNAYIDLALDSFPIDITNPTDGQLLMWDATAGRWINGGHKYSTDEHVVGTWIDGKPIYEKTISATTPTVITDGQFATTTIDVTALSIDFLVNVKGTFLGPSAYWTCNPIYLSNDGGQLKLLLASKTNLSIITNVSAQSGVNGYITIQYTKTTDIV